jgi:NitT/TauT family transport system permease protein
MIRRPISRRRRVALGLVSVVLLAAVYSFVSYRQHVRNPQDSTIPTWKQLGQGVARAFQPTSEGQPRRIVVDVKATYWRLFAGLAVGITLAVVVGMAMGCYSSIEAFCQPGLAFLAKIPPTAMLAVFFVVFGTHLRMHIAMIAFGVMPTLAQAVYQAARKDVPDELIFKAATLGASQPEIIWNVIFKQVLPRLIESIRLQVGPAMVYLIAAEYAVESVGLGYRLRIESRVLNFNLVYFYLAILGTSGFLLDCALITLRRRLCPWFGE